MTELSIKRSRTSMRRLMFRVGGYAPPVVTGMMLLIFWEFAPTFFDISPLLIPPLSSVATSLVVLISRGIIFDAIMVTAFEALSGFIIGSTLGVVVAAVITRSRLLEQALVPYLVALQSLPKVALAPLFVVWLGFGISSKVAIATIISFFPVLINAIVGFSNIESEKLELMRSLVASRWQTFKIVVFPNALPFIFAGLNVAVVFSVTGALVGEFVGATRGLGTLLMQMNYNMDIAGMFSVLVVLAVMGATFHFIVRYMHRKIVFWAGPESVDQTAAGA